MQTFLLLDGCCIFLGDLSFFVDQLSINTEAPSFSVHRFCREAIDKYLHKYICMYEGFKNSISGEVAVANDSVFSVEF